MIYLWNPHVYGTDVFYYCVLILFILSSDVESKTLSYICGRLYIPIFLLWVGVADSYKLFLSWFEQYFAPTSNNLKSFPQMFCGCCILVFIFGWGCLQMFLKYFTKSSGWLPCVFLFAFYSVTFIPTYATILLCHSCPFLVFRCHQDVLQFLLSLKCTWMPYLLHLLL